jgi:hypothetical protein
MVSRDWIRRAQIRLDEIKRARSLRRPDRENEGRAPRVSVGAPGMGMDLEVEALSQAGHSERSEPQSVGP